jgi:hypothetical protein
MELVRKLDEEEKAFKDAGTKRKPMLPGFPGHRDRCSCALCKKQRTSRQKLIDQTKSVREAISLTRAPGSSSSNSSSSSSSR